MSFFSSYGKQKVKDAGDMLISALVSFDPEGATEAEISEMAEKLVTVSEKAAKSRQAMVKEKQEAEQIVALYNQRISAAEILKKKLDESQDPAQKQSIEKSLTTLLDSVDSMGPDVEREKQEAQDAEEFFKYLEQITAESADKLKKARGEYANAVRKMQKARVQEDMAKEKEDAAKIATGISGTNFTTALGAIQKITNEADARADAAKKRTELLKPVAVEEDKNIAAALDQAKGVVKPANLADRLAALKKA